MPTPYEYAKLSQAVYDDANKIPLPQGWKISTENTLNNVGYRGVAYFNEEQNTLVIAHRGTEPTFVGNLMSDVRIFFNIKPEAHKEAESFSSKVRASYAGTKGIKIIEVGHSLGAIHAELNAVKFKSSFVTFDSPGVKGILEAGKLSTDVEGTCYVSAPNIINTANDHVGKLIRIFVPHISQNGLTTHDVGLTYTIVSNVFDKTYNILSQIPQNELSYVTRLHSIDNIAKTFDPHTGEPYLQKEVTTWPTCIDYLGWYKFGQLIIPWRKVELWRDGISWMHENLRVTPQLREQNIRLESSLSRIPNYQLKENFLITNSISNGLSTANLNLYKSTALDCYDTFFSGSENKTKLVALLKVEQNILNAHDNSQHASASTCSIQ